jgi:Tfp pilus assembly PilM family ATPase
VTRILGVDIGHYSIKIAEIDTNGRSWDIIGLYDLPRVVGFDIGQQLKEFFDTSGVKAERVAVGLTDVPVFIRSMAFPFSDRRRVQSAVRSELEDVLPFELSDQIIDFQPLGKTTDRKNKFIVGLSPLNPISTLNKIFETSGVIPTGFFLPAEALGQLALYQNLGLENNSDSYQVLIDIGFESTQLAIKKGYRGDGNKAKPGSPDESGVVDFRQFPHGIRNVIEWIQRARNVDFEEARKWLLHRAQIKSGAQADLEQKAPQLSDELSDDIKVAFRPIVVEIYQFIQNFRSKEEKSVSSGFITGGVSHLLGLKEFLSEELRIPLHHWASFTGFNTLKATVSQEQERSFTLALALASRYAIRRPTGWLNFRRSDQARRKILTSFYDGLSEPSRRKPLILGLSVVSLFLLYGTLASFAVDQELSQISNEVSLDFRRLNRDLGKKAEKFPNDISKLRELFESEKANQFGASASQRGNLDENLSPRKQSQIGGDVQDKPRSEFILELSQIKAPQGYILNSLNLKGPRNSPSSEIKIDSRWIKNPESVVSGKELPSSASSESSRIQKEAEALLGAKGYKAVQVEVLPNDEIKLTANWLSNSSATDKGLKKESTSRE